jgi:hypothetical protein
MLTNTTRLAIQPKNKLPLAMPVEVLPNAITKYFFKQ